MPRTLLVLAQVLPLGFAVIAFAFGLTSTTSRNWSYRHFYDDNDLYFNTTPIFTEYRSPFIICSPEPTPVNGSDGTILTSYPLKCLRYQARGVNRTSCELYAITQNNTLAQTGDRRLCQQIHYAGNLSIAGTTFIGLGFFLTIIMTAVALLLSQVPETEPAQATSTVTEANRSASDKQMPSSQRNPLRRRHKLLSSISPYVNATLIIFLVFGAILELLAQFYGVLAFTMSAPDNSKWSFNEQGNADARDENHDPWVQGSALTVYASLAWFFAGISVGVAGLVWRTPHPARVI